MTNKEFVIWFKGFVAACDEAPTEKQWERLKEELDEVEDDYVEQPGTFEDHSVTQPPYNPNPYYYGTIPMVPSVNPTWVGDPPGWMQPQTISSLTGSGTVSGVGVGVGPTGASFTFTTASSGTTLKVDPFTATVWNDKMGAWHYTNYPEGFGYYKNGTLDKASSEETKKQLLD